MLNWKFDESVQTLLYQIEDALYVNMYLYPMALMTMGYYHVSVHPSCHLSVHPPACLPVSKSSVCLFVCLKCMKVSKCMWRSVHLFCSAKDQLLLGDLRVVKWSSSNSEVRWHHYCAVWHKSIKEVEWRQKTSWLSNLTLSTMNWYFFSNEFLVWCIVVAAPSINQLSSALWHTY